MSAPLMPVSTATTDSLPTVSPEAPAASIDPRLPATLADERAVIGADRTGDPLVDQTLDRFCAILGTVAGDIALTYGARGGVYIAGGIGPRLADRLANGSFRDRFEAKGRLSDYMREIPTALILHPYAALVGAARELKHMEGRGL